MKKTNNCFFLYLFITRWQVASIDQLKLIPHSEGAELKEEEFQKNSEVKRHRHPFEEIGSSCFYQSERNTFISNGRLIQTI